MNLKKNGINILIILTIVAMIVISALFISKMGDTSKIKGSVTGGDLTTDNDSISWLYGATESYPNISVPSNSLIKDAGLYKCTVDSYNREKGTNLTYEHAFTEKQLSNLKKLDCKSQVKDFTGLEKMTSLQTLRLNSSTVASMNLSKNVNLKTLVLKGFTNLSSLSLTKNTNLTTLMLNEMSNLTSLNLTKNTKLSELVLWSCYKVTSLNLTKNTNLSKLNIDSVTLKSLNLTKNTKLTGFALTNDTHGQTDYTSIKSLNLSKNTKLKALVLTNLKQLTSLNLTQISNLENIQIHGLDSLKTLVFPKSTKLKFVSLENINNVEKLNLSKNTGLETLMITGVNNLKALSVLKCAELKYLSISYADSLTSLNLSKNTKLEMLELSNMASLVKVTLPSNKNLSDYGLDLSSITNKKSDFWMNTFGSTTSCSACTDTHMRFSITSRFPIVKVEYAIVKDMETFNGNYNWKGLSSKNLTYSNTSYSRGAEIKIFKSYNNMFFKVTDSYGGTKIFGPYNISINK